MLFVDGLRYDLARRLAGRLAASQNLRLSWRLAPVPTITATAKPIVTPVADQIGGAGNVKDFLPLERSSGRPATMETLRAAMTARGIEAVRKSVSGLVKLLHPVRCKINLIAFNEHPGSDFAAPDDDNVRAFQNYLLERGMVATLRAGKGRDIDAACGQLKGRMALSVQHRVGDPV